MKKMCTLLLMLVLTMTLSACGAEELPVTDAPTVQATPEVSPMETLAPADSSSTGEEALPWPLMEGAVTVKIGLNDDRAHSVTMYENEAALTMLDYLDDQEMRFPSYTYEEEAGFVEQPIRGDYDRADEVTVTDIHAGDLFLLSGGYLRLYFKDVPGANILATPVGYIAERDIVTQEVMNAYYENLDDVWGVSVYFLIQRTAEW